jgi:hypothetical protein
MGSTGILGDWYGNVISVGRVPIVLFANEKSLLAFLLPLKRSATLIDRFREKAVELMGSLDGRSELIQAEQEALAEIRIGKTRDRAVLGTMTDFAFQCRWRYQQHGHFDLAEMSAYLWGVLCGMLKHVFPTEQARALLQGGNGERSG